MDLNAVHWKYVDWINVSKDREKRWAVVNTVMKRQVAKNAGNFLTSWGTVSFSRQTLLRGVGCIIEPLSVKVSTRREIRTNLRTHLTPLKLLQGCSSTGVTIGL
jgi:hypothetical protein